VAQWLARPGESEQNLSIAMGMMDDAASRGVELLLLPELWSCGYDPDSLPSDAQGDAEPLEGPRSARLSEAARRHEMWLAAGSVPELGPGGQLYDTAVVFNPQGQLVAWHRKAHLYSPTLEQRVFTPGESLTTFVDPTLGTVGLVVGFDGDFPEVPRTMALRGARLILAPSACEIEGATAWDLLYPAVALSNSQWWVQANQAGSHPTSTLLGASRIVAPTGTVVAEASRAVPGNTSRTELLVHRIDLHLAHQRDGLCSLLEDERRPDLYMEDRSMTP
jgi:predicted amidohydrolase